MSQVATKRGATKGEERRLRVLSVCSGIGTDAVAWEPLGFEHLCFAEIEKFPSAVLKHRWPAVPNEGEFTKIGDKYRGAADVLVGGTPCQSFSVAGLRGGLADDRGNLALEFLRLADHTRPRWVVWENVPGVLSSNGGRDFGSILGGLGQLGYGWAYRILDAQYFGVPQRRRRVFVVGHLGDWRGAAAVLFERHSLQGDHPPRREKGQRVAGTVKGGSGERGYPDPSDGNGGGLVGVVSGTPGSNHGNIKAEHAWTGQLISGAVSSKWAKGTGGPAGDECYNLVASPLMSGSSREAGHNARSGHCKDSHIVPVSISVSVFGETGQGYWQEGIPPLRAEGDSRPSRPDHVVLDGAQGQAVAFNQGVYPTLSAHKGGTLTQIPPIMHGGMAVRRLTPRECERLQGLPDDYTFVPYNGKPASDGPRYKAIGNGMAVPVMRWIGERIKAVATDQDSG